MTFFKLLQCCIDHGLTQRVIGPDGTYDRFKIEMGLVFYEARYYIDVLKSFLINPF